MDAHEMHHTPGASALSREVFPAVLTVPDVTGTNSPLEPPHLRGGLSAEDIAAVEEDMWGDDPRLALSVTPPKAHPTKESPRIVSDGIEQYVGNADNQLVTVNQSIRATAEALHAVHVVEDGAAEGWPERSVGAVKPQKTAHASWYNLTSWHSPEPDSPLLAKVIHRKDSRDSVAVREMVVGNRVAEAMASPAAQDILSRFGFSAVNITRPLAAVQTEIETTPTTDGVPFAEHHEVILYEKPRGDAVAPHHQERMTELAIGLEEIWLVNGIATHSLRGQDMQIDGDTIGIADLRHFELLEADYSSLPPGAVYAYNGQEWTAPVASEADGTHDVLTVEPNTTIAAQARDTEGQEGPVLNVNDVAGVAVVLHNPRSGISAVVRFDSNEMHDPSATLEYVLRTMPQLSSPTTLATVVADHVPWRDGQSRQSDMYTGVCQRIENQLYVLRLRLIQRYETSQAVDVTLDTTTGEVTVTNRDGSQDVVYNRVPPQPIQKRVRR